jgi:hypothetical protein
MLIKMFLYLIKLILVYSIKNITNFNQLRYRKAGINLANSDLNLLKSFPRTCLYMHLVFL